MIQAHTYDLAFLFPYGKQRPVPEIVFIINKRYLPETIDRLCSFRAHYNEYINAYINQDKASLSLLTPDLFGYREFGFGSCGYATLKDGKVYLHLPLRPHPWTQYVSITIFLLTKALGYPFEDNPLDNRQQDLILSTMAEFRSGGYGHAVGGLVFENILNWLRQYARKNDNSSSDIIPLHPKIIRAQKVAFRAINSLVEDARMVKVMEDQIYGWVIYSGAFTLNCPGNACDLSVYPSDLEKDDVHAQLSCHNLDTSNQQLILLAGLAQICQLARESS
jgi:hypothetical protein